eukprot:m.301559 g.301559  ORF g.301559 m.301559 type:complete len:418 (+) comp20142_c0_seq1:332-1585(+)
MQWSSPFKGRLQSSLALFALCTALVSGATFRTVQENTPNVHISWSPDSAHQKISRNATMVLSGLDCASAASVTASDTSVGRVMSVSCIEQTLTAVVYGLHAGHTNIDVQGSDNETQDAYNATTEIRFVNSLAVVQINKVIGWIYVVAWSLSFYPQAIYNFNRKSVIGLNFDYLTYNITGFFGYMMYNIALYWSASVQAQYKDKHGDSSTNPVQLNDVVFTMHAVLLTSITIAQCFIYDRGTQRISTLCKTLVGGAWLYIAVTFVLAMLNLLDLKWLNFLNALAYIKMGVTLIKYIPQAIMNYKRKSTVGWSIGNVLLDFTGGAFSILQMVLQYWNNDDPTIFLGDPTKLGLGMFSIMFDLFFMVQHYILYPRSNHPPPESGYSAISGTVNANGSTKEPPKGHPDADDALLIIADGYK